MIDFKQAFGEALAYDAFLDRFATSEHRRRWADVFDDFKPSPGQRDLLSTFVREMNALCLTGAWCGDCINQCPILQRLTQASPKINLRFQDRDADPALSSELTICGGRRVPVVVFLSEDFQECGRYGDRTLSRYREMARSQTGAACPTGLISSQDDTASVADDWLAEFERIQLMLRLSPRLRARHGD